MPFSFGSDPEFMVIDADGCLRSAIDIVKASKKTPKRIGEHTFYYDNVLAECTIPPGNNKDEVLENTRNTLLHYSELLAPYKLVARAASDYPASELTHKDARKAGCKPESCAYKIDNVSPKSVQSKIKKGTLRTAGGHVHLGTKLGKNHTSCLSLVRMLDLFLAIPAMYIDHDETTAKRKEMYGVAGRYRQPKHGLEYRSLSNFWLASPKLVEIVYDICDFTIKFVEDGKHNKFWTIDEETLASNEFWNNGGDPTTCHTCNGYDVAALRRAYDRTDLIAGNAFMLLAFKYLPDALCEKIAEACQFVNYDLYKEWNI